MTPGEGFIILLGRVPSRAIKKKDLPGRQPPPNPSPMKKIFYGWWIVLGGFFLSFYVGGIVFFSFTAFFEPLVKEFGWSYTQVSFAISLRGLEMGLLAPFVGILVDRFGSRKLAFCGTVTVGLGFILLSFTRSLAMFYGGMILIAFGAGGCTAVVLMAVIANWFRRNVGKALGVMASGIGASGFLVPIIVKLIDTYQWRTTLVILGVGMWMLGIPLSLILRNKPEQYGDRPDGEPAASPLAGKEEQAKETDLPFKAVLRDRAFLYLNLAEAMRHMSISAVSLHIMPYLGSLGIPRSVAGLVAAGLPLFSIIGRLGLGWMGDVFDKRYVMAAAYSFMALGMIAFHQASMGWVLLLFLLLYSPGFGASMVLRGAIVREYFGRGSFGKIIGFIMGTSSIGGIIGPTLAGWVFDTMGRYHLLWAVLCLLLILAMGLILRIQPAPRHA